MVDNMRSMSIQHDYELGKIHMFVEGCVFFMPAILNIKGKILIRCKPA